MQKTLFIISLIFVAAQCSPVADEGLANETDKTELHTTEIPLKEDLDSITVSKQAEVQETTLESSSIADDETTKERRGVSEENTSQVSDKNESIQSTQANLYESESKYRTEADSMPSYEEQSSVALPQEQDEIVLNSKSTQVQDESELDRKARDDVLVEGIEKHNNEEPRSIGVDEHVQNIKDTVENKSAVEKKTIESLLLIESTEEPKSIQNEDKYSAQKDISLEGAESKTTKTDSVSFLSGSRSGRTEFVSEENKMIPLKSTESDPTSRTHRVYVQHLSPKLEVPIVHSNSNQRVFGEIPPMTHQLPSLYGTAFHNPATSYKARAAQPNTGVFYQSSDRTRSGEYIYASNENSYPLSRTPIVPTYWPQYENPRRNNMTPQGNNFPNYYQQYDRSFSTLKNYYPERNIKHW